MKSVKKLLCMFLCIMLTFGICACNPSETPDDPETPGEETPNDPETPGEETPNEGETAKHMLDGKKVIFIGDSFVYYGKTVLSGSASRYNDQGYFYQICKNNGANVSVTNWTYSGKSIKAIYDSYMNSLKDYYYDYVVINLGRNSANKASDYIDIIGDYMSIFKAANPQVKLSILVSSGCHNISVNETLPIDLLNNLDTFEQEFDATIIDWGKLVADVIRNEVNVPGAKNTFNKNSFIIQQSSKDGYHPNMLAGYITSLMTYCAITGETAVGQEYDFCYNSEIHSKFNTSDFISTYYKSGTTNFDEIFKTAEDMNGLQILIDRYLEEKAYLNYNFAEPVESE